MDSTLLTRRCIDLSVGFVAVWLFRLGYRWARFSLFRRLPGPPFSSMLWGHEWDLYNTPPGQLYAQWARTYGGIVQFDGCFGKTMLSVTDARAVKHILADDVYNWPKPEGAREWFLQLLGAGILYTEGEETHKRQRQALSPALIGPAIRDLTPAMFRMASKVQENWDAQIQKAPGDSVDIDVMFWANRMALDTIGLVGFSYDFNSLSGEALHPVAEALDSLTNSSTSFAAFAMKALVWQFPSILRAPSKKGKLIAQNREDLGRIASQVWGDAVNAGEDGSEHTLLSRLIEENHAKSEEERMGEQEIRDHISTLISAGYEPVSCTIAWALHELSRNQHAQSCLRDELRPSDPDFERLHAMPYLDAVFRETLRLHPPILELHHVAAENQFIPLETPIADAATRDVYVPKGTIVAIPVSAVQQDPMVWGADAHLFRPERWLDAAAKPSPLFELLAFSRGPRKCLGRIFAEVEIKALLVTLVRQFHFAPLHEIEPFQSFVIRPRVKGETESSLPLRVTTIQAMKEEA